mmetsp:Transcript_120664/g.180229  ORF Transcript_120664/g.180229 Transcript_120664/m.180229 type:complete len:228 (-) Transcript_120664:460-1143(-)
MISHLQHYSVLHKRQVCGQSHAIPHQVNSRCKTPFALHTGPTIAKVSLFGFLVNELLKMFTTLLETLALLLNVRFHFFSVSFHIIFSPFLVDIKLFRWQFLPALANNLGQTLESDFSMGDSLSLLAASFLTITILALSFLVTIASLAVFAVLSFGLVFFIFIVFPVLTLLVGNTSKNLGTFIFEENIVRGQGSLRLVLRFLRARLLARFRKVGQSPGLEDSCIASIS